MKEKYLKDLEKLNANTTRREQIFKEIHDSMTEFSKLEVNDYNNENEHLNVFVELIIVFETIGYCVW